MIVSGALDQEVLVASIDAIGISLLSIPKLAVAEEDLIASMITAANHEMPVCVDGQKDCHEKFHLALDSRGGGAASQGLAEGHKSCNHTRNGLHRAIRSQPANSGCKGGLEGQLAGDCCIR